MSEYKGAASEHDRAASLLKQRERIKAEGEKARKKLEDETERTSQKINTKFSSTFEDLEAQIRAKTYGLVTLDEMKAQQQMLADELKRAQQEQETSVKARKKKKSEKVVLSFSMDGEDEEEDNYTGGNARSNSNKDNSGNGGNDASASASASAAAAAVGTGEEASKQTSGGSPTETPGQARNQPDDDLDQNRKSKRMKNPAVDTSFLPDREREERERQERKKLEEEWLRQQQLLKNEKVSITYSYWDGSGHRRSIEMLKGDSIENFLAACLKDLRKDIHELRTVTPEQLMYVKEDIIIPSKYTFYDFIVSKARGKSGPLFSFDVHDDVRLVGDANVEKNESHAGKVMLRSWYERHKHIFPANRWETYDPEKKWDKYTISDKLKNKDK